MLTVHDPTARPRDPDASSHLARHLPPARARPRRPDGADAADDPAGGARTDARRPRPQRTDPHPLRPLALAVLLSSSPCTHRHPLRHDLRRRPDPHPVAGRPARRSWTSSRSASPRRSGSWAWPTSSHPDRAADRHHSAYRQYSWFDQIGTLRLDDRLLRPDLLHRRPSDRHLHVQLQWFPSIYDTTLSVTDWSELPGAASPDAAAGHGARPLQRGQLSRFVRACHARQPQRGLCPHRARQGA